MSSISNKIDKIIPILCNSNWEYAVIIATLYFFYNKKENEIIRRISKGNLNENGGKIC